MKLAINIKFRIKKRLIILIGELLLSLAFLFSGINKFLTSPEEAIKFFPGIGENIIIAKNIIGAIEVLAGTLILIPKTSFVGALLIAITMLVAIILHLTILGISGHFLVLFIAAIALFGISIFLIWYKKK